MDTYVDLNSMSKEELIAHVKQLDDQWRQAYAAFAGVFDTPLARMQMYGEYATDARKRLYEFNKSMQNHQS